MTLNMVDETTALVLAASGAFTFAAVFLGCLYTRQRQKDAPEAKRNAAAAASQGGTEDADGEVSDSDNGDAQKQVDGVGEHQKWPCDPDSKEVSERMEHALRDPVDFCNHIQSQMKKTQHQVCVQEIEQGMTEEQRFKERDIQRQQLQDIFQMMEAQKETFGIDDMSDVKEQMKLYS